MADTSTFKIPDFSGGMNDGPHAAAIKDDQFPTLYNWILFGGEITRRGGIRNSVKQVGPPNAIFNSLFLFSYDQNKAVVIIGANVGLFKLEEGNDLHLTDVVTLNPTGSFSAGTLDYPWYFAQINGVGYAIRRGVGVRRFGRDFHSPAGITPPSWAPTLTDGAAGVVEVGAYYGVATYRNSRTGAESNPGPASSVLNHAGSKRITWSGLDQSNDSQVDTIRLWRTTVNNTDEYFLVDEIPVASTTYDDNKTVDSLGALVSNDNGLPPAGARSGCIWDDTLVLQDGTDVYVSEILLPESFSDTVLNAYRDDGAEIRAVLGWGRKLVVGKTNKIHVFTRTAPRTFQRSTLDERNGCASQRSMKVIGYTLYWFSGNAKNICKSDGYGSQQVVNTELRALLDRYEPCDPDTGIDEQISAIVWPARNLYILSLPLDGATHNTHSICYNYKDNTFTVFDYDSGHAPQDYIDPSILDPLGDDQQAGDILAVFGENRVYRYINRDGGWGQDDYAGVTYPITAYFDTKMFSNESLLMAFRSFNILADLHGDDRKADFNMELFLDGQTDAYKCGLFSFRTGTEKSSSDDDDEPSRDGVSTQWKTYAFSSVQQAAALLQMRLTYTGKPQVSLASMAINYLAYNKTHDVASGVPCGTVPPPRPDPPAPALEISNVAICRVEGEGGVQSITVTWDTSELADGSVTYGVGLLSFEEVEAGDPVTSHTVTIQDDSNGGELSLDPTLFFHVTSGGVSTDDGLIGDIWTVCP